MNPPAGLPLGSVEVLVETIRLALRNAVAPKGGTHVVRVQCPLHNGLQGGRSVDLYPPYPASEQFGLWWAGKIAQSHL